jgi:hypothetical protein
MKHQRLKIASLGIVLAVVFGLAGPASAEDPERHVAGNVVSVGATSISIAVPQTKKTETFAVTPETVFLRGRQPATSSDVQTGELATVHVKNVGGQDVAATVAVKPK